MILSFEKVLKKLISLLEPPKSRKVIAVDFKKERKKFFNGLNPFFVTGNAKAFLF